MNPGNDAVPFGVVTVTTPEEPAPTIAVIPVDESMVNDDAGAPPNFTKVVPVKFDPLIVTEVPLTPCVGVNDVITGPL